MSNKYLTHNQLIRKHVQTLRRRLNHIRSRKGGSYDIQEAAALTAAIEALEKEDTSKQPD